MTNTTTINVSKEVRDEIASRGNKGDSYDDILREILGVDDDDP